MSTEQTQEPKCPAGGESENKPHEHPGFKDAIPMIAHALVEAMGDEIPDEQERAAFKEHAGDPDGQFYHVIKCAFISGVHYALQVPPLVSLHEFQMYRLKQTPTAEEMLAKLKEALKNRPDEVEASDAK